MEGDRIFRAFPAPAAPISWLHLASDAVYAGHIGDGGLPSSTLMRIDRATLETDVLAFVYPGSGGDFPSFWRIASANESREYESLVGFMPAFSGMSVGSVLGQVTIDLDGIRHLFDPTHAVSPVGQVLIEAVTRCGITCFEITYRRTTSTARWVYPPEMPLAAAETITVDCGSNPAGIEVRPVVGFDPAWTGRTTGCEAVLSFGRWAWYSHYFQLEDGATKRFTQTPGPWVVEDISRCFGDPATRRPACDIGHEGEYAITYMTISSVSARGTGVTVTGTEWDVQWVGEYEVGGPLREVTKVVDCSTPVEGESERGEDWVRYLDGCLLAELVASGEELPGIYAMYEYDDGRIFGVAHVPAIQLP